MKLSPWLHSLLGSDSGIAFAVCLGFTALYFALRSTAPHPLPGSSRPRGSHAALHPPRFFGWLGLRWPLALALVLLSALFPVSRPRRVLLVSRALCVLGPTKYNEYREGGLAELRRVREWDESEIDATTIVGDVLDDLSRGNQFEPETSSSLSLVSAAVESRLTGWRLGRRSTARACPDTFKHFDPWLIETVEYTVLAALAQRHRVRGIVAVVSDRRAAYGWVWGGLPATLGKGLPGRPESVDFFPANGVTLQHFGVRLAAVVRSWRTTGKRHAQVLFAVDGSGQIGSSSIPLEVRLNLRQMGVDSRLIAITRDTLEIGRTPHLELRNVTFDEQTNSSDAVARCVALEPYRNFCPPLPGGQSRIGRTRMNVRKVLIQSDDPSLAPALTTLTKSNTRVAVRWREELKRIGLDLELPRTDSGTGAQRIAWRASGCDQKGAVDVDAVIRYCNGTLLVSRAQLDPKLVQPSTLQGSRERKRILSQPAALPGGYGYSGLSDNGREQRAPRSSDRVISTPLTASFVLDSLLYGADMRMRASDLEVEWDTLSIRYDIRGDTVLVYTWLSLPKENAQGLLGNGLSELQRDPESVLALATAIVEAVYASASRGSGLSANADPDPGPPPRSYLRGETATSLRVAWPLRATSVILFGLIIYASQLLRRSDRI